MSLDRGQVSVALLATIAALTGAAAAPVNLEPNSSSSEKQWHLRYLKATQAHNLNQGEDVIVAVLDTGVSPHPDLAGNLLNGADMTLGGSSGGRSDSSGHGTGMAGLIAATGRGGAAQGIAPQSKILPVVVTPPDGRGNPDVLAEGIDFAASQGAKVISISSVGGASPKLVQAIRIAAAADITIVAAAGNRPEDTFVGYPAVEEAVIAVGGVDRTGNHAAISVAGPEIDVVAPAVDIYSTGLNGGYRVGTGTSDATAIVAGAAALIRSKYPNLPAAEVAHRLTATAVDKGPPGRDDQYGYGVIDLVAALTADVPPLGFESSNVTPPASVEAVPDKGGDGSGTVRGLATLGVLVTAVGGYLFWRRRRRADDPPPRVSR
ncbi:S8 family serine peptidase [Micromonospora sp. NPDC048169]|uniref:S8 family serine peptidase n=1 Tax=Micromonospora sp. NPDC048169 TaxID=3154711 RepID=UPI003409545E